VLSALRRLAAAAAGGLRVGLGHAAVTLADYGRLIRLDRPIGIWLLLWPALWALWVAGHGHPREPVFAVFVAGVVLMRSAGCAINDFADRRVDPHVARTRGRPLATGAVSPAEAILIALTLAALAFALVLTLNPFTIRLSVVGAALTVVYPFLKRFFPLPQLWLGAAFSWSIPMAFAAEDGRISQLGWLLFIAGVLWTAVYDTMYAMVDREDDLRLGVRSSAILFGDADRVVIAAMQAMVLAALWFVGQQAGLEFWFRGALGLGALLFLWQQWLIRAREPRECFRAFLNNHWFGLVIFLGIALDYLFRPPSLR
jgi:4-hydroxybenzoate polyprenyltransferase